MPRRLTPLVNGEFYHIFNRGVAKQPIFFNDRDYQRFLLSMSYYRYENLPFKFSRLLQIPKDTREQLKDDILKNNSKMVEIVAFCLMPNHFHLLVRQMTSGGISKFIRKLSDSYTRYFNTKNDRVGPVFQGAFKSVHVEDDEQLLHLSRYIHLNPLVSSVVWDWKFIDYPWSSLKDFIDGNSSIVDSKPVLEHFSAKQKYLDFVLDHADYAKELAKIKHLVLE